MSKFYIKEIDNYIKMTTEEKRLWDTKKIFQDSKYVCLSYCGWSNESSILLIKFIEKLNSEIPVKIFCDKKTKEILFDNKKRFYNRKIVSNKIVMQSLNEFINTDEDLIVFSTETGNIFGVIYFT